MKDSYAERGVVVVHSKLKTDGLKHLDVELPTSMVIVRPSATDDEFRSVGIDPLTPEEAQHLKEKVDAELRRTSRVSVIDETHSLFRDGKG